MQLESLSSVQYTDCESDLHHPQAAPVQVGLVAADHSLIVLYLSESAVR